MVYTAILHGHVTHISVDQPTSALVNIAVMRSVESAEKISVKRMLIAIYKNATGHYFHGIGCENTPFNSWYFASEFHSDISQALICFYAPRLYVSLQTSPNLPTFLRELGELQM